MKTKPYYTYINYPLELSPAKNHIYMPVEESTEEGVPAQWTPQTLYDFRSMPDGPRGYKVRVTKKGHVGSKRRLDEYREQVRECLICVSRHAMHVPFAMSPFLWRWCLYSDDSQYEIYI